MPHLTHETLEGPWYAPREERSPAEATGRTLGGRTLDARWEIAGAGCCVAGSGAPPNGASHPRRARRDAP